MRAFIALLMGCLVSAWARAEMLVGVQLFDMYGVEAVSVMPKADYDQLKGELKEETAIFKRVYMAVKRDWDDQYKKAVKMGDKEFPKFPTKEFMAPRSMKIKNFATQDAADKWLKKQEIRVNAWMTARAQEIKNARKKAKGTMAAGYGSRDDKKNRQHAEKKEMTEALKEHLGEAVEVAMAKELGGRPIPRTFIVDPVAGPEKYEKALIEKQEAAMAAYQAKKSDPAAETPTPTTTDKK